MKLDRTCIKCGIDFVLEQNVKSSNICKECKNAYQKAMSQINSRVAKDGYKDKYPYRENDKIQRFRTIRNKLDKMDNREEWQAFFKEQIYKLETDDKAVLIWIYDRRGQTSIAEDKDIPYKKSEYEDTRSVKDNNKSWFD